MIREHYPVPELFVIEEAVRHATWVYATRPSSWKWQSAEAIPKVRNQMAPPGAKLWGIQFGEEMRDRPKQEIIKLLQGDGTTPGGMSINPVVKIILYFISGSPHTLTIYPSIRECNADTNVEDEKNADHAHPKGLHYPINKTDDPKTKQDERKILSKTKGTGKGTDAFILFSPGLSTKCNGVANSFQPDDMLLHEMVHALRIMQGQEYMASLADTPLAKYTHEEEWLAILIENVYRSSKGRTDLRGGHIHGSGTLSDKLSTSEGFLGDTHNKALMNRYFSSWWPVCRDLSRVKSLKFNPFEAFGNDPLKYQ